MSWPIQPLGPREPRLEPVESAHHAERVRRDDERREEERQRRRRAPATPQGDDAEPGDGDGHIDVLA